MSVVKRSFPQLLRFSRWYVDGFRTIGENIVFDDAVIISVEGSSTTINQATGSVLVTHSVTGNSFTINQSTGNAVYLVSVSGSSTNISQSTANISGTLLVSGTSTNISEALGNIFQSGNIVSGTSFTINESYGSIRRETFNERFTNTSFEDETEFMYLIVEQIG